MKKMIILMAAVMLLLGVSGQAMAYFSDGDLIQAVYQKSGSIEVLSDLGALSTFSGTETVGGINFSSIFGSSVNMSSLYVAYFVNNSSSSQVWTSGPIAGQTSGVNKYGSVSAAAGSVETLYASSSNGYTGAGTAQVIGSQTGSANSYYKKMDLNSSASAGGFAGFIAAKNGEAQLNGTTAVDQYLYFYQGTVPTMPATAGVVQYDLKTNTNGSTTVAQTPIPPSVLLLGSGLMGLVGIRRKQSV